MKRNHFFQITLIALASLCARAFAADDLPKRADFSRYQAMLDHSPFAVATAAAPPPVAPNFAKDLFIANAAHAADGDLVTVASSSDKNFKKYLTTKTPVEGFGISNIEWSDRVGATKVTISKDGQFATLTFNQALLTQPLANAPIQPQQQIVPPPPGTIQPQLNMPVLQPTPAFNLPKPMPVPSLPTPPPRVRGVIPRNPTTPVPNQPVASEQE